MVAEEKVDSVLQTSHMKYVFPSYVYIRMCRIATNCGIRTIRQLLARVPSRLDPH